MITTPVRSDIHEFAAAVRAHLDDLPADEVDDLLDGLEADLSDQAAEAGDDFTLPDATTYAAELRAAAGLPERSDTARVKKASILQVVRDGWHETGAAVRKNPVGAWILDLLSSLRPVGWILRGVGWYLLAFFALWFVTPGIGYRGLWSAFLILDGNIAAWVFLLACVFLSIQWGRGRWLPARWLRVVRTLSTVAVVLTLPILIGVFSGALWDLVHRDTGAAPTYTPGLSVDGQRVRNIFAFDAEGNAIPMVQLFDQDGNPLTTVGRDIGPTPYDSYFYGGGGPVPVPYTAPGVSDAWNIYPLREIPPGVMSWDPWEDVAKAKATTFPFLRVQPIPTGALPSPEPSPTSPIVTPSPDAEAAP
ncbi:hypothetical protein [Microbacterium sp. RURRCA19A]|uniref:hypothetical protein n=1 Tax=Microbacterium sp. RURRCA19A TaxID=1907391 RepID=UPI000956D328|nr:hypothetical protein [Microbacterium sp. RURRCA19A]SIR94674.1 hypothetical protein SAMN05880568_1963 [Microbacterium sp. RURRCA19A]